MNADWREAADATLLDPGAFVRLQEWGGTALIGKMVELYFRNAPLRVEEIRAGLDEGDADRVERGAHALKSSSGNLGAERLRRLCQLMEDIAEAGDLDTARTLHPLLLDSWEKTLQALEGNRTSKEEDPS